MGQSKCRLRYLEVCFDVSKSHPVELALLCSDEVTTGNSFRKDGTC